MAKKPRGGFDMDDLMEYYGRVSGKAQAGARSAYGSSVNAALTKKIPQKIGSVAKTADLFATGGLGTLLFDLNRGKKMSKKQIAAGLGYSGLNFLPMGKIAKLGGKTYKTVKSGTETIKQLRLLSMILGGE